MPVYRKRSVKLIEAEIDYLTQEVAKKEEEVEKLQNRLNYLQSELAFNKEKVSE